MSVFSDVRMARSALDREVSRRSVNGHQLASIDGGAWVGSQSAFRTTAELQRTASRHARRSCACALTRKTSRGSLSNIRQLKTNERLTAHEAREARSTEQ